MRGADLSDTGVVNDQLLGSGLSQQEDSFQKMYSKELDLDEGKSKFGLADIDEVPIILHELNDSAIHFISRDQYERALSLLQKAQTLIDRLQFQKNPNDRLMVFLTMHNMALCFQKLGALEECALCLEASLQTLNSPFIQTKFSGEPSKKLKKLKYECKARMQVCALLSQLHRHKDALQHAERSVQIAQYMISDLLEMCKYYYAKVLIAKKNEQIAQELQQTQDPNKTENSQFKDLIYYDDSVSMLERTAYRILPILQEVASRMIKPGDQLSLDEPFVLADFLKPKLNMKAVLGYLNQSEWLYLLNIGNIMQITPLTVHDLYSNTSFEAELSRDSILEKLSFLAVSYFCISTELRFLVQVKDDPQIDPLMKKKESEFWHAKALEVSVSFLPSECPLVTHILTSYQKHHAPVQQEIPEDRETELGLKVIRPMPGIDICKFQPMVRQDPNLDIKLSLLPLSPTNYHNLASANHPQQVNHCNLSQLQPSTSVTTTMRQTTRQSIKQPNGKTKGNIFQPQQHHHLAHDTSVEADETVLEEDQDSILNNNKSMMEVIPSSNYKKLLQDFSQIQQNSSDIEDLLDDHKESQEVQQWIHGKEKSQEEIDEDYYGDEVDQVEEMQIIDKSNRDKHNLSLDGHQLRRPKTSQGIRKARAANQRHMLISETENDQLFSKNQSFLHEKVSPHSGGRSSLRQHQSMANSSKLGVSSTIAGGFPLSSLTNINSGAVTDIKGGSTPIKAQSMANGFGFRSREALNMSRAGDQKTNQSSQSELVKRSGQKQLKKGERKRQEQRSAGKREVIMGAQGARERNQQQTQSQVALNENAKRTMNELFIQDRMLKKRPTNHPQPLTQDPPIASANKSFELDPKYRSQHFGSQSRSKSRGKVVSSRSKDKIKNKESSQQQQQQHQASGGGTMNMEELKRQILMKQAILESTKSTRRKSTGGHVSIKKGELRIAQMGQQQQQNIQTLQWLSAIQATNNQQLPVATGSKIKLNTHQMIKKFLNERQYNSSNQQLSQSMLENYAQPQSQQQLQLDQNFQVSNYKMQLSKKILQQQQKLIGQVQMQHQLLEKPQKRSATPMLDDRIVKDKSLVDIGNNLQSKNSLNAFLRDYMSQSELHNQSLREDSIAKSLKKKASKKATPKNVIANSHFAWL